MQPGRATGRGKRTSDKRSKRANFAMQVNALLWIINLCLFSTRFQHGNTAWPSAINHCNFLLGDFHWGSNNDSTSHGEAFHCLVRQISVNSKSDISSTSQIKKLWCDIWQNWCDLQHGCKAAQLFTKLQVLSMLLSKRKLCDYKTMYFARSCIPAW